MDKVVQQVGGGLLSTGPTPSSLSLDAPFLIVWAWRRHKAGGGKGLLTESMNESMNELQLCL